MKEFKEVQKFTQWWLWIVFIIILIAPAIEFVKYLFYGEELQIGIYIALIIIAIVVALFLLLKLTTIINSNGISIRYFPFLSRNVTWQEIDSIELLDYGFVGGWGIRFWTKYGTVYNVKGSNGLAVKLKDGRKFLIGTQKIQGMEEVISQIKNQQSFIHIR